MMVKKVLFKILYIIINFFVKQITVDYDLIISLIHNVDKNPPTAQQTNQLETVNKKL